MKRVVSIIILCMTLTPLVAFADAPSTGVHITCDPSKRTVRFDAEMILDSAIIDQQFLKDARARNLFLEGKFDSECNLGTRKIKIWGELFEPSERGACGANPGGKIYMSFNSLRVLHYLTFGNECYPSLWSGSITIGNDPGLPVQLELCGFKRRGDWDGEKTQKCVTRSFSPAQSPNNDREPKALFYQDDLEQMVGHD